MLSLNATQLAIVASTAKKVTFLFDIDLTGDGSVDYYYGFEPKTWNAHSYIFKVIGFDPITLSKGSPESGILTPSTTTIKLTNKDNTLVASTFEGATITVRCIMQDAVGVYTESEIMAWTFKVKASVSILQTISLECDDWLAGYLRGDYPNTRLVSDLFPYPASKKDNVCVPLAFGEPFIPLRWMPKNTDADYVSTTQFEVIGDQTALFAAGQFLMASCGVDGAKSCFVDSVASSTYCLKITSGVTAHCGVSRQLSGLTVGNSYRFSFFSKEGTIHTISAQFGSAHAFTAPANWSSVPHTIDWTATVSNPWLYISLESTGVGQWALFDNITVQEINTDGSLKKNILTNSYFHSGYTGWSGYNNGVPSISNDGLLSTLVTLTAASDDLTANLTTVQTDHYCLGEAGPAYTASEARTPKDFGSKSTYLPANYTFKYDTISGSDGASYRAVQVIVPNYSNIQFKPPECLDVPFRFSRSDLSTTTNLANIVNYILLDLGIASGRIDSASVTAAAAIYTTNGLSLNVGLYFQQSREKLLAKLMALGAMVPVVRDKIYLRVLTTTSVRTLTKTDILPGTFSLQRKRYTQDEKDSGYVIWQTAGEPQDQPNKSLISVKTGVAKPADTTIEAEWVSTSSAAKKAAKLALQKNVLAMKEISFKSDIHLSALEPGDMITINDADLGGTYLAMIDRITYDQKSNLSFVCTVFSDTPNDWADLTETDIQIYSTGDSRGYSNVIQGPTDSAGGGANLITGAVLIGDNGEFKTCVSPETTGGFKATNSELVCYNTAGQERFRVDYAGAAQGNVTTGNYSGNQGTQWNQADGKLYVRGNVTANEGTIGGWTLDSDEIKNISSNAGISLNSATPALVVTDANGYQRVFLGKSGSTYGLTVKDELNNIIININDINKNISGWTVDSGKLYNANSYISSASFIAFGNAPPTTYGNNTGVWMGWTAGVTAKAQLSLYTDANHFLQFDGDKPIIKSDYFSLAADGKLTVTEASVRGSLNADDISAGILSARTIQTAGTRLTAALSGGESTVYVADTSLFPSSGSGYIYDSTVDVFTYTGKTGTTLTGCSGVLAHVTGLAVGGQFKRTIVSSLDNETHFYGDRGDGTVEELASIGIKSDGGDTIIGKFGSSSSGNSRRAVDGRAYDAIAVYGYSVNSHGLHGASGFDTGVFGDGVYGAKFSGSTAPLQLVPSASASAPTHSAIAGSVYLTSACVLYVNVDGSTTWQKVGAQ
jgi:hypothetical protein